MSFTIGCDPEIFINKNGRAVAAVGAVPGTKDKPFPVPGGAVQVDGLALEFNTVPVSLDDPFVNFDRNVVRVVRKMKELVVETVGPCNFSRESTADFSEEYLATLPDEAKVLGCDPDYNAYTGRHNPAPDASVPFRSAGGHIHLGFGADQPFEDPEYIAMCCDIVKAMDLYIGLPLKFLDLNEKRRSLYGKAGAFRPKPYGVEYRSPSNYWTFTKARREFVFVQLRRMTSDLSMYQGDASRLIRAHLTDAVNLQDFLDGPLADSVETSIVLRALNVGLIHPNLREIRDEVLATGEALKKKAA